MSPTKVLKELIAAIDAGQLEMNSPEIDLGDNTPPFRWHEEWLHHARQALNNEHDLIRDLEAALGAPCPHCGEKS